MRNSMVVTICLVLLVIVSGCAHVDSTVTRFNNFADPQKAYSYHFIPYKEQNGSVEYEYYCNMVSNGLSIYGWRCVDGTDAKPELLVFFTYGIDKGKAIFRSKPVYGEIGGGTAYSYGTVDNGYGTANYSGTTYSTPTYGVVGSESYSRIEYTRYLQLDILDANLSTPDKPKNVFEGRVLSSGPSSDIAEVLPTMIDALFTKFPGVNGKTEDVRLSLKRPAK